VIVDDKANELQGEAEGMLCIKQAWPSTLRTVYGDHDRCRAPTPGASLPGASLPSTAPPSKRPASAETPADIAWSTLRLAAHGVPKHCCLHARTACGLVPTPINSALTNPPRPCATCLFGKPQV
jgi:hypothetical protein